MSKAGIGVAVVGVILVIVLINGSLNRDRHSRGQLLERLERIDEGGYPLSSSEIVYAPAGSRSDVDRNSKGAVWGEWGEGRWCAGASMGLMVRH